jgi:hypothetical protein
MDVYSFRRIQRLPHTPPEIEIGGSKVGERGGQENDPLCPIHGCGNGLLSQFVACHA